MKEKDLHCLSVLLCKTNESCCAQLRIIIIKYNHNRLIDKELLKQCFGIGSQWLVLIISNVDPSLSVLAQFKSV